MTAHTAMVVEDDPDIATIFRAALKDAGFEVETFLDSEKALARLGDHSPDVVVLDMHMPIVSGAELLQYIRSDERLAATRVIIATADHQLAESLHNEVDLALLKPVSYSQIRDLAMRLKP